MKILSGLSLAFLFCCSSLYAQFETSEVLGTVRDASGAPIPKVTVVLTSDKTGIAKTTISDESGNYDFFDVQIGSYSLTAEAPGFQKFSTTGIIVNVDVRQRVDIPMVVGVSTQVVNVEGAAATLETDSSEHDQVIHTQQIVELPLNGRSYADLALLSTNVHRSPIEALFSPSGTPREASFNVNGMRSTYNNFLWMG